MSALKSSTVALTGLLALFAIAGIALMTGCGATQQGNHWVDPSYHAAPLNKIMVIAVRKDNLRRRMWEDAFVVELNSRSRQETVAIASYQLFPNDLPDTVEVRRIVKDRDFDGVLVVARAELDTSSSEVVGYTVSEPVTTYSRRWSSYVTRYEDVYHPGYSESEVTVSVRTDLLVPVDDGKLVWSVTSNAVDPASAEQFRKGVASDVSALLRKKHFIH
ncbi:MAG: hypothetical protein WAU88_06885 [Candidatus Zixiibacteriota bacterium]